MAFFFNEHGFAGVQKSLLSYFSPTIAPFSPVVFVLELFQDLLRQGNVE